MPIFSFFRKLLNLLRILSDPQLPLMIPLLVQGRDKVDDRTEFVPVWVKFCVIYVSDTVMLSQGLCVLGLHFAVANMLRYDAQWIIISMISTFFCEYLMQFSRHFSDQPFRRFTVFTFLHSDYKTINILFLVLNSWRMLRARMLLCICICYCSGFIWCYFDHQKPEQLACSVGSGWGGIH